MSTSGEDDALAMQCRNIAIVSWRDPWHPDTGGAERYAWEMAQGLLRCGVRVGNVLAQAAGRRRRDYRDGVPIIRLDGGLTAYPAVLPSALLQRRSFDAVIDCPAGRCRVGGGNRWRLHGQACTHSQHAQTEGAQRPSASVDGARLHEVA